jgi:hypothetical protein
MENHPSRLGRWGWQAKKPLDELENMNQKEKQK